jgi:hypothetical protein
LLRDEAMVYFWTSPLIINFYFMSQAFVRETEGEWLHDVPPTVTALIAYLTRENNGIRVYEKSNGYDTKLKREVHVMSNGLSYAKDDNGQWSIVN